MVLKCKRLREEIHLWTKKELIILCTCLRKNSFYQVESLIKVQLSITSLKEQEGKQGELPLRDNAKVSISFKKRNPHFLSLLLVTDDLTGICYSQTSDCPWKLGNCFPELKSYNLFPYFQEKVLLIVKKHSNENKKNLQGKLSLISISQPRHKHRESDKFCILSITDSLSVNVGG